MVHSIMLLTTWNNPKDDNEAKFDKIINNFDEILKKFDEIIINFDEIINKSSRSVSTWTTIGGG